MLSRIELQNKFKENKTFGKERHLFGSAVTPGGYISIVNNLTKNLSSKYLVCGQPESKSSQLLSKTGNFAQAAGFNVLYLHSGFNPELLDAVILTQEKTAFIRKTEIFSPQKYTQKFCLLEENQTANNWQQYLNQGVSLIKKAKKKHDELEEYYIKAMNFKQLKEIETLLIKEIERY